MHARIIITVITLGLGCTRSAPREITGEDPATGSVVESLNRFTLDLYGHMASEAEDDVFASTRTTPSVP